MAAMASAVSGMRVVYDKEGIDPCKCATHYCECVPVTSFRTGINDDESGLHHDYEVWLEKLAPHAPIDQAGQEAAGPRTGCTTAPAKLANGKPLSGTRWQECRRAPEAERNSPSCASWAAKP